MEKEKNTDENGRPVKKKKQEIVNKGTVITVDPSSNNDQVSEAAEKTAVFTFGRMNPPTTGHEKLINKVHEVARQHGAKGHIVVSHSHDAEKNPLPQDKKIKYISKINRNVHVHGSSKQHPNFLSQAKKFSDEGHKHLVMVAGSDRVGEYKKILDKYNGHPDHHNFKSIKVVSAGQRDPDAEGASGISGTKMRHFAKTGDHENFKKGLPKSLHPHAKEIMQHIHEENEYIDAQFTLFLESNIEQLDEVLTVTGRRKKAIAMRRRRMALKRSRMRAKFRFAGAAQLKRRARRHAVAAIKKRVAGRVGQRYATASIGQKASIDRLVAKRKAIINKIAMRNAPKERRSEAQRLKRVRQKANEQFAMFIEEIDEIAVDSAAQDSAVEAIITTSQDKDIAGRKGTQPARYHAGLSKSTKAARDAQFKKQSKMGSRDPEAYKPAPGDATAETKPSKYTKIYHAAYGEGVEMEYAELFKMIDIMESNIAEAVDPTLKARHQREKEALKIKHEKERARSNIKAITSEDINIAFGDMISEKSEGALAKKAEKSGISVGTLRKVYNRGVAAWRTGHRPGTTPEQWGYARVNAFIAKKKKGNLNHDQDLA